MNIESVPIENLHLSPNNARNHPPENIEMICRSLKEFGQHKPLIIDRKTNTVLAGNGRLMAMKKMGWKECSCIFVDGDTNNGLDLMDNRLNELSDWDKDDIRSWLDDEKGLDWWAVDVDLSQELLALSEREKVSEKDKPDSKGEKPPASPLLCPHCGQRLKKKMF